MSLYVLVVINHWHFSTDLQKAKGWPSVGARKTSFSSGAKLGQLFTIIMYLSFKTINLLKLNKRISLNSSKDLVCKLPFATNI